MPFQRRLGVVEKSETRLTGRVLEFREVVDAIDHVLHQLDAAQNAECFHTDGLLEKRARRTCHSGTPIRRQLEISTRSVTSAQSEGTRVSTGEIRLSCVFTRTRVFAHRTSRLALSLAAELVDGIKTCGGIGTEFAYTVDQAKKQKPGTHRFSG